jgi:precorrin-2 dehydrogenase/sirohydrochlorin ferrochelatase
MTDINTLGGGSLLVAWQLKDKNVLIVGGGEVASGRIESILTADANIVLISPSEGLNPRTKRFIEQRKDRITYHDRLFSGIEDLADIDMVLTAIDEVEVSRAICTLCREARIPVNVADIPPSCDFYFGSQIRDGPLQIMISTNGQSPKLANIIRRSIEESLPKNAGEAISKVGSLRSKLKERAPGVGGDVGRKRMRWMVDVCTSWEMEELALLDDELINKLLDDGWEKNKVPSVHELGGKHSSRSKVSSAPSSSILPAAAGFFLGAAGVAALLLARNPNLRL